MKRCRIDEKQAGIMRTYGLTKQNTVNVEGIMYDPSERLMEMNEPLSRVLILTEGTVKVCTEAADGKSLILCYYVQRGVLGDMELLGDPEHTASTVAAITPVKAAALPVSENRDLLLNNPVFMRHLAGDLAAKLADSSRRYAASVLDTAEQRLAAYILESAHNGIFSDVMKDVSMSLGMSYRHMYRILNHLADEKILHKEKEGWHILDEKALQAVRKGKKK